jgi:hypothetical protein
MRNPLLALILLVVCTSLAGCSKLDERDVREFVDQADDAARKRFAPEICSLRGRDFKVHQRFQGADERSPATELDLGRQLFCVEAGKFSRLRQYQLERKSLEVDLATDRKTARITAEYVETLPYFEPDTMPQSPDDFREFQVLEVRDESVIGREGGDIVFLSTDADIHQKLVPRDSLQIPFTP